MANIRIPEKYIEGIEKIRTLTNKDFMLLCDIVKTAPSGVGHKMFVKSIIENLDIDYSDQIGEAIFSFGGLLTNSDEEDLNQIALDITESFLEITKKNLGDVQIEALSDRLASILLNATGLALTFSAYDVITSAHNAIIDTGINTDVRLLFDKRSDLNIRNGLIFFNLKVRVQRPGDNKTEILTMDMSDLLKLKSQIEDAIIEHDSIKEKHKEVINFIDITE